MSFLTAFLYDSIMAKTEAACLRQWRHRLLEKVSGEVLEVGAGTGANIGFYSEKVTGLVLSEPDKHMRGRLRQKLDRRRQAHVRVIGGTAEKIDLPDESAKWKDDSSIQAVDTGPLGAAPLVRLVLAVAAEPMSCWGHQFLFRSARLFGSRRHG